MGLIPGQGGDADLVTQVARAIAAAQNELWPMRRPHLPGVRPEDLFGRAAAAALVVVRQAIEGMEPPEIPIDDASWAAYRLAVLRRLGGAD